MAAHHKHTAGNTPALARIRDAFNGKVYRQALEKWNHPAGGADAVREYVRRFFNEQSKHKADELIDGPGATAATARPDPDLSLVSTAAMAAELIRREVLSSSEVVRLIGLAVVDPSDIPAHATA